MVVLVFYGEEEEDAYWWILCLEKFFKEHETPQSLKVLKAVGALRVSAFKWWIWWCRVHRRYDWELFTTALLWRFKLEWRPILPFDDEEEEPTYDSTESLYSTNYSCEENEREFEPSFLKEPDIFFPKQAVVEEYKGAKEVSDAVEILFPNPSSNLKQQPIPLFSQVPDLCRKQTESPQEPPPINISDQTPKLPPPLKPPDIILSYSLEPSFVNKTHLPDFTSSSLNKVEAAFNDNEFHRDENFAIPRKPPDSPLLQVYNVDYVDVTIPIVETPSNDEDFHNGVDFIIPPKPPDLNSLFSTDKCSLLCEFNTLLLQSPAPMSPLPPLLPKPPDCFVTCFDHWVSLSHNCFIHGSDIINKVCQVNHLNSAIKVFDQMLQTDCISLYLPKPPDPVFVLGTFIMPPPLLSKVGNFMHYISKFIAGFTVGFLRVWQISLVTLSIIPLIVLTEGLYAYVTIGLISKVRKAYVRASEIAEEVIGNVRTVQIFTREERDVKSYKASLMKTYVNGRKDGLEKGLGLGSMHCVLFLSWSLLVWFTSIVHKNIANGSETFTTMLNVVTSDLSLGQAAPDISVFIRAKAVAYPFFKMIERDTVSKQSSKTGRKLNKVAGHIQFKNRCLSYPSQPDVAIFNNFNLDIPVGKIFVPVKGSGSTKSTVVSLIERFYEPLFGHILLGKKEMRELDLMWLRQQIGLVNQEPALFATSIKENILYGKGNVTLEELKRVVKLSDAQSFIKTLPQILDTRISEKGLQLSGGQKQMISVSLEIVKNPSILLLDEATSALHAESEKSAQETMFIRKATAKCLVRHKSIMVSLDVINELEEKCEKISIFTKLGVTMSIIVYHTLIEEWQQKKMNKRGMEYCIDTKMDYKNGLQGITIFSFKLTSMFNLQP